MEGTTGSLTKGGIMLEKVKEKIGEIHPIAKTKAWWDKNGEFVIVGVKETVVYSAATLAAAFVTGCVAYTVCDIGAYASGEYAERDKRLTDEAFKKGAEKGYVTGFNDGCEHTVSVAKQIGGNGSRVELPTVNHLK